MPVFPSAATSIAGSSASLGVHVQRLTLLRSAYLLTLGIDADHKAYFTTGAALPATPFAIVIDGVSYTAVAARAGLPPLQPGFAYLKKA